MRFAPIYRQPESGADYPGLRETMIADIFDAGLQAFSSFAAGKDALKVTSHRALGRKAFVDAVRRADRSIDDIVSSFDFLLSVTPINARRAFENFAMAASNMRRACFTGRSALTSRSRNASSIPSFSIIWKTRCSIISTGRNSRRSICN